MEPARFNELVASLGAIARDRPAAFRRRVRLLVALGYAYVLAVLVIVLGALVALLVSILVLKRGYAAAKLILLLAPLAYVIIRALWVRIPAPDGEVLHPEQAPRLARRVEAIRRALKAPRADVILLTQDHNAAVSQVPRFGIFGGERTYLILGLPLMYSLGPKQLDAVLAHEFGHLSGAHPKFGLWVGRVGITWGRLLQHLEGTNSWGNFIFRRFFQWYVPQLNAHSYALSRDDEFAADADSARVESAQVAGQALATLAVRQPHYDRYWRSVLARVEAEPTPPEGAWSGIPAWMREADASPDRLSWLEADLGQEGLVEDSHPSLRARLHALKVTKPGADDAATILATLVPPQSVSAADHYLGAFAGRQLERWDREWRAAGMQGWRARHDAVRTTRERLGELRGRAEGATITPPESVELAYLVADLDGDEAAIPWLERAVAAEPTNAGAHFMLGRALLARRDRAGVAWVERAMELDVQAMPAGSELLRRFHAAVGDAEGIARAEAEAHARSKDYDEVARERGLITQKDELVPAVLSVKDRAQVAAAARIPGVKALWVARKKLRRETDQTVVIILVEPRSKFLSSFGDRRERLAQAVFESLKLEGKIEPFVVPWTDGIEWLVRKVQKANGAKATSRRGMKTVRKDPWHKVHRRALVLSGVGGSLVAGLLWMLHVPQRIYDPRGLLPADELPQWNGQLMGLMMESGIDMRILIDSVPVGTDLSQVALNEARRLGMGSSSDRRGLFMLVDATTGSLRLEVGPTLEGYFPDGFVGHLLRAHTSGALRHDTMSRSLVSTIMILQHRVREATLGLEYDPKLTSAITDSTRLAAGAGATFSYVAGAPLELHRTADPGLEAALAPGASAEEALERYRQWLSLPVYVPRAHFLTPASRQFYVHELPMTPLFWEHLRYLYVGTSMTVETRGNLAVAYATENPLVTPLYFRRGRDGWQMDVMAELVNSRNTIGGGYSWMLWRSGDPHDVAFADRMVLVDGLWRFRDGANRRFESRGRGS